MNPIRALDLRAWLIIVVFVVLNTVVLIVAAPGGHRETDTENYYAVAEGLLKHGDFVKLDDPGTLVRLAPGYPLLLAAGDVVGGGDATIPVVLVQLLALLVTGLITRGIVTAWLRRYHNLALALVILNPNSLSMAQTLMPITMYALALTASVWAALKYARELNFGHALLAGLFLGLAILFRSDPRFLIILLPVALPLLAILAGHRGLSPRTLLGGLVAAAFAIAMVLPWTIHSSRSGDGYSVAGGATGEQFLAANLGILEKRLNPQLTPAYATIAAVERGIEDPNLWWTEGEGVNAFFARSRITENFFRLLWDYPTSVIIKSLAFSQANMFVSGGAGNIFRLLGLTGVRSHERYFWLGYGDRFSAWWAAFGSSSPGVAAVSVGAIGFAVAMRLIGLFGLLALVRNRHWALLTTIISVVLYSTVILIFNGLSRYRVPVEPLLVILSIYGFDALFSLRRKHKGTTGLGDK